MLRPIVAFGRFWYHFVIGDDWSIALSVALALAVTSVLLRAGAAVWWLVPAVAIVILGISLHRARART